LLQHEAVDLFFLTGHGNLGYGAGHNLVLAEIQTDYHLILNPDVEVDVNALASAVDFLENNSGVGLIAPLARNDDGGVEYLCRRYPSIFILMLRGFFSDRFQGKFSYLLNRYEMRDEIGLDGEVLNKELKFIEPSIISGCFMFYRTSVLLAVNGFDSRYFLYFEDYDLSLRTKSVARISYVPEVKIVHSGGGAAKKGGAHRKMFIVSAFRFFSRFGWKLF
jgi:hypothetical protein